MNDHGRQVIDLYHQLVDSHLRQTPFDASSRPAFQVWQRKARRILRRIIGELPAEKIDFGLERRVVEEHPQYLVEELVYWTRPGLQASAYLLTPHKIELPAPAVLCLHGHSRPGKDDAIDPDSAYGNFARRFAAKGCIALCPEQIGLGGRTLPEDKVSYQVLIHGLNMLGHTLIGLRYWDLVRALDLLETMQQVDPNRIGVMGLSLGGEMTLFLAALQTRVCAASICGYLSSHLNTFLDQPHCTCGHLRDLAKHFEHVDLAALIAPRPLFVDSGRQDPQFPSKDARAAVRQLRPIYELHEKPRADIGIEVHNGAHQISGTRSIPWMLKQLKDT